MPSPDSKIVSRCPARNPGARLSRTDGRGSGHHEQEPPDVFNHNLETVPRLYRAARPGSDFEWSLDLLENFKKRVSNVPTKSGLMLGLGETDDEVIEVLYRMCEHGIGMLTLGQYLQPSRSLADQVSLV